MKERKYNWEEIQKKYESGMSWRELMKEYGFCWATFEKYKKLGILKSRTKTESLILDHKKNPSRYIPTDETKKKISLSRSKYLKEHPDQVPYLLNHYSKGDSYPERYFKELFEVEKIDLKHHTQIGLYQLDFYNLECKIDIEIDGDQHHLDKRIAESDIRRTEFLESQGWKVFRVKWSDYQKLPMDARKELIDKIRKMVTIHP
jgi:very-short-patch-repair endonuclease